MNSSSIFTARFGRGDERQEVAGTEQAGIQKNIDQNTVHFVHLTKNSKQEKAGPERMVFSFENGCVLPKKKKKV